MSNISPNERLVCLQLLKLFKIDGRPANEVATEGQLEIFHAIVFRKMTRVQVLCSTQYGKSLFVALGILVVSCIQEELVSVVAPTEAKSKVIMRYYIDHLGDSPIFYSQLEKNTKLERLRMEENKDRIVLRSGGGIVTISASAGNARRGIEAAMGEGSKIVISDESSLIPDEIEATVFRMIAGKGPDAFYCKIGNPFYRNHFLRSNNDPNYHHIFIDYKQALTEGRYNEAFIEEARKKPHFDILFECKFPKEDFMDDRGYIRLFTDAEIENASRVAEPFGEKRLGADIAEGGGDYNVIGLRTANYATILTRFKNPDTMMLTGQVVSAARSLEIDDRNIFLDTIGVGKGAYDRLVEQKYRATSVKFSEKADDEIQFANLRAECYWRFKSWLSSGGCLDPEEDWSQLQCIKYKVDSSGRMQIMPKDEMRKVMHASPDAPDAIAMTFARKQVIPTREQREYKEILKQFDSHQRPKTRTLTGSKYLR